LRPSAVVLAKASAVIASIIRNSCVLRPSAVVLAKVSAVIASVISRTAVF
jgi:hypothetical protein